MQAIFSNVGEMQAVAEMYSNSEYIADRVMPRVPTRTTTFRYKIWRPGRSFTNAGRTLTGRLSSPNIVDDRWGESSDIVSDHFLQAPVPFQDQQDASFNGIDIRLEKAEYVQNLIMLSREQRVAAKVFDSNNYGAGLVQTLSGTDQWSDFDNSDPLLDITLALNEPLVRPNIMVIGIESWQYLRTHPRIVQAIRGAIAPANNAAVAGIVTEEQVASLFGLEEVLVGRARQNDNEQGLAVSLSRIWSNACALLHRNTSARSTVGQIVTWGYTAQFGPLVNAGIVPDPNLSGFGGFYVRVGESVNEKVIAIDAGYLFLDTTA